MLIAIFDDVNITSQSLEPIKTMGSGLLDGRGEEARVIVVDKAAARVTVICFVILLFKMFKSNFENGVPRVMLARMNITDEKMKARLEE